MIGQVDFYRALRNSPANDSATPSATGLYLPNSAIAVDKQGNLVAVPNGRVVRFPKPFDHERTADGGPGGGSTRPDHGDDG